MFDVTKFMAGLHDYLREVVAPINASIKALEERQPISGKDGIDGRDGKDGADGAPGLPGKDGQDGADGKDGTPGEPGLPGNDGRDGKDGNDGLPGRDGADGKDGKDGAPGNDGSNGRDGKDGLDGKDGATVSEVIAALDPFVESKMASWALDFERRAQGILERAIDRVPVPKDGRDGRDGRDALELEDFDVCVSDDLRTIEFTLRRGDVLVRRQLSFPVVIDRGVYKHGDVYQRADGVTFAGSFWIAQKGDLAEKPGTGDGWRLAVKKGRDA